MSETPTPDTPDVDAIMEAATAILKDLLDLQEKADANPSQFGDRRPAVTRFYRERSEAQELALLNLEKQGIINLKQASSWEVRLTDTGRAQLALVPGTTDVDP